MVTVDRKQESTANLLVFHNSIFQHEAPGWDTENGDQLIYRKCHLLVKTDIDDEVHHYHQCYRLTSFFRGKECSSIKTPPEI